jgi:hypothetical protein
MLRRGSQQLDTTSGRFRLIKLFQTSLDNLPGALVMRTDNFKLVRRPHDQPDAGPVNHGAHATVLSSTVLSSTVLSSTVLSATVRGGGEQAEVQSAGRGHLYRPG